MRDLLYRSLLRCPRFPGKSRFEGALRSRLAPKRHKVAEGLVMCLDPLEWPQAELLASGVLEPRTTNLFARVLRPGDAYVDVGAHVGFHTLVARRHVGDGGTVIAVEPQPYNGAKLLENWRANAFANIHLVVAAAGDVEGSVVLREQSATDKSRLSLRLAPVNDMAQRFQVPIVRLDRVLADQGVGSVRLLKIDVEGYEPEVLRGLGPFAGKVENVVLELLDAAGGAQVLEELKRQGFARWRTVDGDDWAPPAPLPENNVWASREVEGA